MKRYSELMRGRELMNMKEASLTPSDRVLRNAYLQSQAVREGEIAINRANQTAGGAAEYRPGRGGAGGPSLGRAAAGFGANIVGNVAGNYGGRKVAEQFTNDADTIDITGEFSGIWGGTGAAIAVCPADAPLAIPWAVTESALVIPKSRV